MYATKSARHVNPRRSPARLTATAPITRKATTTCVREHPAADVHQAEPHVSDAAARDLRVVGVGRERAICHPTVNRDRHEHQPAGDRRRGDPSPALTPPGERQHVDTRDERALGPHRDEERRDDRLPLRWTDQRKRDEAGERHGLHARRGVQHEWQVQREEDASQHGRTIVAAPEEHGQSRSAPPQSRTLWTLSEHLRRATRRRRAATSTAAMSSLRRARRCDSMRRVHTLPPDGAHI